MCVLIGGHYLQNAYWKEVESAQALVGLGIIILLVLSIRFIRYMVTYADPDVAENEIEEKE